LPIPPPQGVQLTLSPATPSVIDQASLKAQLENVGLNCSELTPEFLQERLSEVTSQLPAGAVQSFRITAPAGTVATSTLPPMLAATSEAVVLHAAQRRAAAPVGSLAAAMTASQDAAIGNWTENDSAQGYAANLEVIQFPSHFSWLMSQLASNGFPGVVNTPPAYTGNYANAQAIQTLFINVATTASSVVVKGVDQATMRAVFSNVIQPLTDGNIDNYDQPGNRVITLAENYNTTTGYADAVGFVAVDWRLQLVASLGNTQSGATTSYSTAVSRGFTFSTTQSLSISEEVGVNIEIVTEKTTVTFALSFTEEWTTTETKTISFECPPGKKAFVYQGTLMSKLMTFSADTAQYTWASAPSKALTEVVVTTELPIGSAPSNPVMIQS
jgi:hypothetical protein